MGVGDRGRGGAEGGWGVIISLSSALILHFFYISVCLSSESLSIFLSFFVSLSHSLTQSLSLSPRSLCFESARGTSEGIRLAKLIGSRWQTKGKKATVSRSVV